MRMRVTPASGGRVRLVMLRRSLVAPFIGLWCGGPPHRGNWACEPMPVESCPRAAVLPGTTLGDLLWSVVPGMRGSPRTFTLNGGFCRATAALPVDL